MASLYQVCKSQTMSLSNLRPFYPCQTSSLLTVIVSALGEISKHPKTDSSFKSWIKPLGKTFEGYFRFICPLCSDFHTQSKNQSRQVFPVQKKTSTPSTVLWPNPTPHSLTPSISPKRFYLAFTIPLNLRISESFCGS